MHQRGQTTTEPFSEARSSRQAPTPQMTDPSLTVLYRTSRLSEGSPRWRRALQVPAVARSHPRPEIEACRGQLPRRKTGCSTDAATTEFSHLAGLCIAAVRNIPTPRFERKPAFPFQVCIVAASICPACACGAFTPWWLAPSAKYW